MEEHRGQNLSGRYQKHRVNRVAMATFWRTFHQPRLVSVGGARPPSFALSTVTYKDELHMLQLKGQIHSPYFSSTPICNLWPKLSEGGCGWFADRLLFYTLWLWRFLTHCKTLFVQLLPTSTIPLISAIFVFRSVKKNHHSPFSVSPWFPLQGFRNAVSSRDWLGKFLMAFGTVRKILFFQRHKKTRFVMMSFYTEKKQWRLQRKTHLTSING
jgi:hypothetical protein